MSASLSVRLSTLTHRADFRAHPLKASAKRAFYHARWRITDSPWSLSFLNEYTLEVPKGGGGALIFYQGSSEPEVTAFLRRFLKPGMLFVDVGAHFGEYSVLASSLVGPTGAVHSFEPSPSVYAYLRRNIDKNHLLNVYIHQEAISDRRSNVLFTVCSEPSLSRVLLDSRGLRPGQSSQQITVHSVRLDEWGKELSASISLIKADIEGLELPALRGASGLLAELGPRAPAWIFEYEPPNWADYGHTIEEAHDLLGHYGYGLYSFGPARGLFEVDPTQALQASKLFGNNLLALKPDHLSWLR